MASPLYGPWPTGPQRLLLDAALTDAPGALAAFAEWQRRVDLEAEIGWNSVRLLPLAYRNLVRQGCTDPRMGLLKGVYRRVWSETNHLLHRTIPVLRALQEAEVEMLLLKGVPIALAYYRNPALRAMADVDLCVRFDQVEATAAVLRENGWRPSIPLHTAVKYRHSVDFRHDVAGKIDLHWHVLKEAPHGDANDRFWAASEPLDFQGVPVRQLHPEHALLHAIVHGLQCNHDPPIRWITDSMVILAERGNEVDWPRLLAFAERHRVLHRLALGARYLADHFGVPVPPAHLKSIRAVRPRWIERLEATVILDAHKLPAVTHAWTHTFVQYCRYSRTRNPLRFAVGYPAFLYRAEAHRKVARLVAGRIRRLVAAPAHPDAT